LILNNLEDKAAERICGLSFYERRGRLRCYAKAAMDTNKIITTVETEKRFMGKPPQVSAP
jgi:hypothetical protein